MTLPATPVQHPAAIRPMVPARLTIGKTSTRTLIVTRTPDMATTRPVPESAYPDSACKRHHGNRLHIRCRRCHVCGDHSLIVITPAIGRPYGCHDAGRKRRCAQNGCDNPACRACHIRLDECLVLHGESPCGALAAQFICQRRQTQTALNRQQAYEWLNAQPHYKTSNPLYL